MPPPGAPGKALSLLRTDSAFRRRSASYAAAVFLHLLLLAAVILAPPAAFQAAERAARVLDVRLYTVAGGEGAESDAPLFEPPMMDAQLEQGAPGGEDSAVGRDDPAAGDSAEAPPPAIEEDIIEPPAPEAAAPETPAPEALPRVAPRETPPTDQAASEPSQTAAASPPDPAARPEPGVPVAVTQPPEPATLQERQQQRPPRFADILARAQERLDPADFEIIRMAGGTSAAVRESFCLSSSDANREAGNCPEGPNPASALLAEYGLRGLGERAPQFLEDLSRMEFQLRQLGAGAGQIERIMLALQEARREAIETPALIRQMDRDEQGRTDHLGIGRPPTPRRARDPSGEP